MLDRRLLSVVITGIIIAVFTVGCMSANPSTDPFNEAVDELIEESKERARNNTTATARSETETAQAKITETPSPVPVILPPPVFSIDDPEGDTTNCQTGESVDNPGVDLLGADFYEPASFDPDYVGWMALIQFGAFADLSLLDNYSFSLVAKFQVKDKSMLVVLIFEKHADEIKIGVLDESGQNIVPGTEGQVTIDDQGRIRLLFPRDAQQFIFNSYLAPEEGDLPLCDQIGWTNFIPVP